MSSDGFTCSCGARIDTRDAAKAHLKASPGHRVRGLFYSKIFDRVVDISDTKGKDDKR